MQEGNVRISNNRVCECIYWNRNQISQTVLPHGVASESISRSSQNFPVLLRAVGLREGRVVGVGGRDDKDQADDQGRKNTKDDRMTGKL